MSHTAKSVLGLFAAFLLSAAGFAQTVVRGTVQDEETKEPVASAIAAVIGDSGIVSNVNTDESGRFLINVKRPGDYRLRVSFIGYGTITQNITLEEGTDTLDVGVLPMLSGEQLGEALVTATAARVQQVEDTTVYNAAAYRVPTGATLEALVKQFPGIQVSDDGTITWNGKTVSEFLVNGKDFFKGDTETAMKNLPADLVSQIKAYDKKSDYAEQTGIDDGNETTVLDIVTKRELNESWITNVDLAVGTHHRWAERLFISRFTDQSHLTLIGNLNNTNSQGMGGPRGFGGSQGQTINKMAALSYSWENGKKRNEAGSFRFSTDWRFNNRVNDLVNESSSETFLNGASSTFANSLSRSRSSNTQFSGNAMVRWMPDSLTNISFRPQMSYSRSKGKSQSQSATFNDDPNAVAADPLDSVMNYVRSLTPTLDPSLAAIAVNASNMSSRSTSHNFSSSASLNVTRRLNRNGRNVTFALNGGFGSGKSRNYSLSNIVYHPGAADQSNTFQNRYTYTPSDNWNYSLRLGYVEPLTRKWFAELQYEYSHRYNTSDRTLYQLERIPALFPGQGYDYFTSGDFQLGTVAAQDILEAVVDEANSQYARYHYHNNNVKLGVRYNANPIFFNAGVSLNPQHTTLDYVRGVIDTRVTRNVFNVAPEVRFRYRISRTNNLDFRYQGRASQPSMTDLIDVWDDSNPLNISGGNPGLKPAWTNSLNADFRAYNTDRQQGMSARLSFEQTSNSISSRVVYDEATGVRYTRPDNINGNWNTRGNYMFNTPLDYDRYLSMTTVTNFSYQNAVGYISTTDASAPTRALLGMYYAPRLLDGPTAGSGTDYSDIFNAAVSTSRKSTTRTLGLGETLNFSYKRSWYDVGVQGRVEYQHARATLNKNADMDTWNFSYGANANFTFDWGMALSTDIRMSSRRGYSVSSMNTNELLWNAQISQSFLRNRAATVSLQFYDILHKQSNISRAISATQRSDSRTNAINSYIMLHFIYKLNIFPGGGSSSQQGRGQRGQWGGGEGGPGGGGPGGGGGGFGGGPGGGGPGGF
ncbi:MAG: TonB-dependent receptor [Bacteroidaceae bacterium]|nr:TonB-dependent receptor [Bacteroidaceae bacterium]